MSSKVWRNINSILNQSDDPSFGNKLSANTWARFLYIGNNVQAKAPFKQWCDKKLKGYNKTVWNALKNGQFNEDNLAYIIQELVQGFEGSGLLEKSQRGSPEVSRKKRKKDHPVVSFLKVLRWIIQKIFGVIAWFWNIHWITKIILVLAVFIFAIVKINDYRNGDIPPIEDVFEAEVAGDDDADNEATQSGDEAVEIQEITPTNPENTIVNGCFLVDDAGVVDSNATARLPQTSGAPCPNGAAQELEEIPFGTPITVDPSKTSIDIWYDFNPGVPGCGSDKRLFVSYVNEAGATIEACVHASKIKGWDW